MSLQTEVKTVFSHLGRSPLEAKTYLAALSLGSGTAAQIAQKTGEGRTKIYFHIKNLVQEGLLKESRKGQRQVFVPLPPAELADIVTKWAADLRGLVPQLEAMHSVTVAAPLVEVSESQSGHKRVYDEITSLPEDSFFRVVQGRNSLKEELYLLDGETLQRFFTALIARNITTRGIFTRESLGIPKTILSPENYLGMQKRPSDLVILPESTLNLQQLMFIYGNKVAFLFPETAFVMTITHQGIADVLGAAFDALHSFGEKVAPTW